MTIRDRIAELIDKLGVKTSAFEKAIGLSNSYLRNVKNVSADTCVKIVEVYPNVSLVWLLLGQGEMFNSTKDSAKINSGVNSGDNIGSGPSQRGNKNKIVYNDPKTIEAEERKICDLEKEIANLKERLVDKDKTIDDKDARIAELNKTIARLEKMNDFLMQQK